MKTIQTLGFAFAVAFSISFLAGCNMDASFSTVAGTSALSSSKIGAPSGTVGGGSTDGESEDINTDYDADCYCRKYSNSELPVGAPASLASITGLNGSLNIEAKNVGDISLHNGSLNIFAEKVGKILGNNGRVRVIAPIKGASVESISQSNGSVVICGATVALVSGVHGSVFVVGGDVKVLNGVSGQVHLVNGGRVDLIN